MTQSKQDCCSAVQNFNILTICFLSAWSHYQFQENRDEEGEAPNTAPDRSPLYAGWAACSSAPFWWPLHEPLRKGDHRPLWEDDGKLCIFCAFLYTVVKVSTTVLLQLSLNNKYWPFYDEILNRFMNLCKDEHTENHGHFCECWWWSLTS